VAVAAQSTGGVYLSHEGGRPNTFRRIGLQGEDIRELAVQGAEVLVRVSAYMDPWGATPPMDWWTVVNRCRAIENMAYVVASNQACSLENYPPFSWPGGSMIVDIGGGTTDIAVLSLNGLVVSRNLRIAGDHLNMSIMSYIRDQFKVHVGEKTAEDAKIALASIANTEAGKELVARGRDVVTGLPREVIITDADVRDAVAGQVDTIVETVKSVLETTPPEVLADIMQRGIHLSGGGALIPGLAPLLEHALQVPVIVVPDPLRAVIRGAGIVIENIDNYQEILIDHEGAIATQL
jgi:rod shape-determining protein MreB